MFRNKGITYKLIIYILSGIVIIFSSIMAIDYQASREILMRSARQNAANLALSTVNHIESILRSAEKIPENLAPILENNPYSEKEIKKFLSSFVANNDEIFGSCLAYEPYSYDPSKYYFAPYYYKDSDSVAYKNLGNENYQYFDWNWYRIPKKMNEPYWTEPYFDESGGNIIMSTYSVPFYKHENGKRIFNGIITVDIDLSWLNSFIDSIEIIKSGYAFLISKDGRFLTHPVDSLIMNESIFSVAKAYKRQDVEEIGIEMITGKTGFVDYKTIFGEKSALLYYTRLPVNDWSLAVVFPKNELFADLHSLFVTLMILGVAGIIITFITITLISKKITRPIKELALVAVDIGKGAFDAILPPVKSADEIGMLTQSFEAMKTALKSYILNLEKTTAAKNKMESELKIAHDIQQGIIPKIFPPFPERDDVDLFAILDPAREVGGDLYDFFFLDDKNLAFAIGDVSGKGVPASLFMAITRTLFRAKAVAGRSVSQIVSEINQALCIDNENAMFVTFFLGIINLETGEINFCNAGHNYPYILRNTASIEKLDQTHGTALGLFDTVKYKSGKVTLQKKETLVLYTDGIPEAMDINQNLLGDKNLETMLRSMGSNKTPGEITNAMLTETRKFASGAEQSDDITILVLTYYLEKIMSEKENKHLEISNRIDEIHKVEIFIEQLCEEWNIGFAEMHKVNLAMEEIVSNIINYGYRDDKKHTIEITASYTSEVLKLTIVDDAMAFNPLEHKDPKDLDRPIEEREIGGLGIFFVKKMMDRVEYRHESNHNILIIEKMISQE